MLDQVYSTNFKNLFCSVVILFLSFEGLYESLSKAFFRCALGAHAGSSAFPGKAWMFNEKAASGDSNFTKQQMQKYELKAFIEQNIFAKRFRQIQEIHS